MFLAIATLTLVNAFLENENALGLGVGFLYLITSGSAVVLKIVLNNREFSSTFAGKLKATSRASCMD
ncbi:MAG: hypothetical protein ACKPGQ_07190 [Dolichospermum sp.]